jgi:hypothetical protein
MRRTTAATLAVVALTVLTACDPLQPWRHELVSRTPGGVGGNGDSTMAFGASNAAVFASDADDLVPGDDNSATDVFVRDLERGTTSSCRWLPAVGPQATVVRRSRS